MSKMMDQVQEVLTTYMCHPGHQPVSYTKYKEHSKLMVRVCDFVELFSTVNQQMLAGDGVKVGRGKKTKLSPLFREASMCLARIEELIKDIRILPVKQFQSQPRPDEGAPPFMTES
jgi:hypothetical protein